MFDRSKHLVGFRSDQLPGESEVTRSGLDFRSRPTRGLTRRNQRRGLLARHGHGKPHREPRFESVAR